MKRMAMWGIFFLLVGGVAWACSAKGPADPYTGLVIYPTQPLEASAKASTVPADAPGPFKDSKFFKGWTGSNLAFIVVPVGTTLSMEGVIQDASGNRPSDWEEGEAQNLSGSTVDKAPLPKWTISGNGRGDYTSNPPPSNIGGGGFSYKEFEMGPDAMIIIDSPQTKATWNLKYDRETAMNQLKNHPKLPLAKVALKAQQPPIDLDAVLASNNDAEMKLGDWNYSTGETFSAATLGIKDAKADEASALRVLQEAFQKKLPQKDNLIQTESNDNVEFTDPGTNEKYNMPKNPRVVLKAGYIAMQDWYPTGRYNTKFMVSSPSANSPAECPGSKLEWAFHTPTYPDYWTFDVNSGLESQFDAVWCWVEGEFALKANRSVPKGSNLKEYIDVTQAAANIAVGGVLVTGQYSSGQSSSGRNSITYVTVIDTAPPASFSWACTAQNWTTPNLKGETGKTLKDTAGNPAFVKFQVFDNNPLLALTNGGFNKLKDIKVLKDLKISLDSVAVIEAGKKKTGPNMKDSFKQYMIENQDGFAGKLVASLTYGVCVPSYAALKGKWPTSGFPPFPMIDNRLVVPTQRFIWKTIDVTKYVQNQDRVLYNAQNQPVTSLSDLDQVNPQAASGAAQGKIWWGYASYNVQVPIEELVEPVGYGFAENSAFCFLPWRDAGKGELEPPQTIPPEAAGTPMTLDRGIYFYPWHDTALKIFPSAGDGSGNLSPSAVQLDKITSLKFGGVGLPDKNDAVATWTENPGQLDWIKDRLSATSPIKGGGLEYGKNPGNWGNFLFISKLKDIGKPNIALQILNSKLNKWIMYGNLYAGPGQSEMFWKAFVAAAAKSTIVASDSNLGEPGYSPKDSETADIADEAKWTFADGLATTSVEAFQKAIDEGTYRPWFSAVPATMPMDTEIKSKYWNGDTTPTWNNTRLAFQHENRLPLVFQYWTWDNINPVLSGHAVLNQGYPNGVFSGNNASPENFKPDALDKLTAKMTLEDKPAFPNGVVPVSKFWREYNFMNPNDQGEECSISLEAGDQPGSDGASNTRRMKVYFRVHKPGLEQIHTLEDNRSKMKNN